ncbi:polysaccharide deacetylase family protein [Kordia jejudonensis]|uniref:polysaccharide deacetylase family protein n=1 Tax=Kordia jejudonensis TaxID=1348245 RepID=UPI000628FE12|nr:polysaccharide deacetylase family protein [Kordia jejudonensis]
MLLVYTQKITPRLRYTFKHLITRILGIPVDFTTKIETFIAHNEVKMSYAKQPLGDEFFVRSHDLLFEQGVGEVEFKVLKWEEVPCFFVTGEKSTIPYDIFAASFYMLSRYEEYLPYVKDEHGRYTASESLAFKHDFLRIPVVDIWCQKFKKVLENRFETFNASDYKQRSFSYNPVINIPIAYAYKKRGIIRTLGGYLTDIVRLRFSRFLDRSAVLLGMRDDPYDNFEEFVALHKTYKTNAQYFFQIGDYSTYDHNISVYKNEFIRLIKNVSDYSKVGLLASYDSFSDIEKLKIEKKRLNTIINRPMKRARQHYNMLSLPKFYRNLIDLEFTEDYSMGYHDTLGFRAGTCSPFYFYDISMEIQTPLKVHPFCMLYSGKLETTLPNDEIMEMLSETQKVNGTFIGIFHNVVLSENNIAWKELYINLLKEFSNE